eukprot:SAG25_NODE_1687_length_2548_cov_6.811862_4_plen_454_part_00
MYASPWQLPTGGLLSFRATFVADSKAAADCMGCPTCFIGSGGNSFVPFYQVVAGDRDSGTTCSALNRYCQAPLLSGWQVDLAEVVHERLPRNLERLVVLGSIAVSVRHVKIACATFTATTARLRLDAQHQLADVEEALKDLEVAAQKFGASGGLPVTLLPLGKIKGVKIKRDNTPIGELDRLLHGAVIARVHSAVQSVSAHVPIDAKVLASDMDDFVKSAEAIIERLREYRFGTNRDIVLGEMTAVNALWKFIGDVQPVSSLIQHTRSDGPAPTLHLICERALKVRESAADAMQPNGEEHSTEAEAEVAVHQWLHKAYWDTKQRIEDGFYVPNPKYAQWQATSPSRRKKTKPSKHIVMTHKTMLSRCRVKGGLDGLHRRPAPWILGFPGGVRPDFHLHICLTRGGVACFLHKRAIEMPKFYDHKNMHDLLQVWGPQMTPADHVAWARPPDVNT